MTSSLAALGCDQQPVEEDDEDDCQTTRSYDYIGVIGGRNKIDLPTITTGQATALGLVMGHRYNDLFSAEFEYVSFGTYDTPPTSFHATAVSISGLHTWQLSENLGLYGKLGIGFTHVKTVQLQGVSVLYPGINLLYPTYAIGFEYAANKDISLRLGYDIYRLKIDPLVGKSKASLASLTFLYKY